MQSVGPVAKEASTLSRIFYQAFALWSGHTPLHSGLDGSALHTTHLRLSPLQHN